MPLDSSRSFRLTLNSCLVARRNCNQPNSKTVTDRCKPAAFGPGPEDVLRVVVDSGVTYAHVDQRSVLVLRDMQQMEFAEICNELSLSASNVRVLLHRGRMRLMKMVDHFEETGSC